MGIACDISEEPQHEATKNPKQKATPSGRPHPRPPQLPEARGTTPDLGRYTRSGALHPIRGATPEQKRCIAYGSGAAPQHTRTNAELAHRTTPRHNQQPSQHPVHKTRPGQDQVSLTRLTNHKSHAIRIPELSPVRQNVAIPTM